MILLLDQAFQELDPKGMDLELHLELEELKLEYLLEILLKDEQELLLELVDLKVEWMMAKI